ncbi:hypothetical protein TRVL_05517 [Trypanosoma vivax]|nr:hypothetical protein TRVL_05517 [Trypanosoma vivax]
MLGDKCASVSMSAMNGRLWETLYVPQADAEVTRETQHFILSIMKPSECRCLTMLLMPDAAARPLLPREQSMVVHIFSLDALAVHNGVVCLQGWKGEEASDRSGTRSCSGCLLPEAVEKLLTSFSSLYIAWRLLEHHQSCLEGHVHVDDELVQDILGSRTFQAYLTEVDVSHLLYAQEGAEAHVCVKSINFGYFNGLMTRFLQTINFTAVPAQPVMFMSPECEDMKNSRAEVETEATGCGPPHLPLIIKIALIFVAANGEEKQVWTSAPEKNRLASGCRVGSPGIDPVSPQGGSLILRCIVKTAPQKFMRLSAGGYRPSAEAVWEVLQGLLKELKTAHRGSRSDESPTFSITQTHQLTPGEVRKAVLPTAELPATLRSSIDALLCKLVTLAAQYSLERSLESSAYDALQGIVSGTGFGMGDSPSPSRGDEATDTEKGRSATCTELRGLAQESDCVTERAAVTPGLQELLEYLVAPALLGSSYFQLDTFSVGFASELQRFCNANGTEALVDVLTIHLAQDRVCIVPAAHSCYLFVPNRKHFGSWWLMLHVTTLGDSGAHQIAFLCDKGRDPSVCIYLCQRLKNLIVAKVKRVSQLYLLKQLRGTQHADDELIPRVWGDQFTIEPRTSRDEKGGTAPCSLPEFCCRGSTVLSIPLYYKLQHQCKKILSRISSSSSKLELFSVYNRPQCFVVADDVQRDTFHYIRLIFVKDTAQPPKTTEPSPILSPMDRCPVLLVQLFSATEAAFLERPLCKLKSFCYLLAMQELQGHLNYVRHEFVSTVDLLCLHYTRLDSITVDLPNGDEASLDTENAQFALLLLVLRLKEKKFKYFKLQEASGPVASNFVEYYGLQRGSTRVTEESSDNGRAMVRELAAMRFVKTVERPADVIVSCTLRVGSGGRLLIDRFLTKVPEQRLSVGRCEDGPLNQIDESIQDAVAHWRFFALSSRFARLSLEQVGPAAEEMVRCCAALPSTDGSMLRVKNFTLDSASPTRLPSLIERLVGIFEPFSPICVECGPDRPPMHISGFPWHWAERLQGDPLVGLITVYLLCGYQVVRASADSEEMLVEPTRSMHVTHPDLPVSVTTVLLQSPLLREHSAGTKLATEPRILLRISLANGITAILFNHLDSDNALRLMGHFVAEAELESDMMHDIMLQRMGFLVPSYLTEAAVARVCHADDFVTTHEQPLKVHPGYCCERIRGERLLPRSLGDVEPLVSVLEGLLNRGLLFEETVRFSDVVMALYNECPGLSLEECRAEAQCLLHDDVSRGKYTDATVRLPSASGLASELFVACTFRRHMKMAYMLLASQCYHREITDALECCSSLWSMSSHDDSVTLAKAAVLLQSRGRQIFGCRVPDFTLRPRTQWRPSDDILPPSLPRGEQLQSEFCPAIDAALRSYVQHFSRVFPLARIIDLDASSREVSSDTSLLKRLTCRYGKVVDPDGREATFAPHMYYALVPVSGATRLMELPDVGGFAAALPHSLFRDGLFIVEIGFQVVYFALDVFLVSGTALTNNASTQIVTRFKHMLKFSNVLYDVAAARLLHSIQMYSTHLPGQWQVSNAIANLLKHYPKPPSESLNIVVVFDMEKTFVQKMRRVLSRKRSDSTSTSDTHSIQVLPAQGEVLLREFTGEKYQYGGLVAWPSSKFFVLLSTARDAAVCQRMPNDDLCGLAKHANFLLTRLLADSMLLQYVDLAWVQFCRFEGGKFNDVEGENEDILHCLRALQSRSIKVSLHSLLGPLIQSETNWKDLLLEHYRSLSAFCSPYYVLHLLTDKAIATSSESAVGDGGGSLVLTVGGCEEGAEYLVTLEFSSDSRRFVLTKGTLHRKRNERMTGASAFSIRERELVECVTKMLSSLLWRSACFV